MNGRTHNAAGQVPGPYGPQMGNAMPNGVQGGYGISPLFAQHPSEQPTGAPAPASNGHAYFYPQTMTRQPGQQPGPGQTLQQSPQQPPHLRAIHGGMNGMGVGIPPTVNYNGQAPGNQPRRGQPIPPSVPQMSIPPGMSGMAPGMTPSGMTIPAGMPVRPNVPMGIKSNMYADMGSQPPVPTATGRPPTRVVSGPPQQAPHPGMGHTPVPMTMSSQFHPQAALPGPPQQKQPQQPQQQFHPGYPPQSQQSPQHAVTAQSPSRVGAGTPSANPQTPVYTSAPTPYSSAPTPGGTVRPGSAPTTNQFPRTATPRMQSADIPMTSQSPMLANRNMNQHPGIGPQTDNSYPIGAESNQSMYINGGQPPGMPPSAPTPSGSQTPRMTNMQPNSGVPSRQGSMMAPPPPPGTAGNGISNTPPVNSVQMEPGMSNGQDRIRHTYGIMRLLAFSEAMMKKDRNVDDEQYWSAHIGDHFTNSAELRFRARKEGESQNPFVPLPYSLLVRFFMSMSKAGVERMSFSLDGATEDQFGQEYFVFCSNARWTMYYANGFVIELTGPLRARAIPEALGPNLPYVVKLDELDFETRSVEKLFKASCFKIHPKGQPEYEDTIDGVRQIKDASVNFPREPPNAHGLPQTTMRMVEFTEGTQALRPLIGFGEMNRETPIKAMKGFVMQHEADLQIPQGYMMQGNTPLPARGTSFGALAGGYNMYPGAPSTPQQRAYPMGMTGLEGSVNPYLENGHSAMLTGRPGVNMPYNSLVKGMSPSTMDANSLSAMNGVPGNSPQDSPKGKKNSTGAPGSPIKSVPTPSGGKRKAPADNEGGGQQPAKRTRMRRASKAS